MSKRSELLLACMLGNRWTATQNTVGATMSAASPSIATTPLSRPHLETLWYSIRNFVGAGAANATVQIQVRHASEAGTVIASVDHLVSPSSTAQVAFADMKIAGKRGGRIFVTASTFVASLTTAVSMAGWVEDTNG